MANLVSNPHVLKGGAFAFAAFGAVTYACVLPLYSHALLSHSLIPRRKPLSVPLSHPRRNVPAVGMVSKPSEQHLLVASQNTDKKLAKMKPRLTKHPSGAFIPYEKRSEVLPTKRISTDQITVG